MLPIADTSERETEEELISRLYRERQVLLEACQHTLKVFRSMSDRGRYPLELLPDTKEFLGKQGFKYLMEAIDGVR